MNLIKQKKPLSLIAGLSICLLVSAAATTTLIAAIYLEYFKDNDDHTAVLKEVVKAQHHQDLSGFEELYTLGVVDSHFEIERSNDEVYMVLRGVSEALCDGAQEYLLKCVEGSLVVQVDSAPGMLNYYLMLQYERQADEALDSKDMETYKMLIGKRNALGF
jgi:hypothetical protein